MKVDTIVLGAGIVGISVALHLQKAGRSTLLVDRRGPGEETSYGNAGLIQREGVYPYGFPHDFGALFRYAMNNTIDASYHWSAIPKLAPFLFSYWMHSRASQHEAIAHKYAKLIEHCVTEHDVLAQEAGATELLRRKGWMKVFRTEKERDERLAEAARWKRDFDVNYRALDMATLKAEEPHLDHASLIGGLHWTDPVTVIDPLGLSKSYVALFEKHGGKLAIGDAATLVQSGAGWTVTLADGTKAEAKDVVVALGPWADVLTNKLGYRLPLAVKRGYHMHYKAQGNAVLNHPVLDTERGYFLAPMQQGIRLTTGAEFADRDAPKTPVQLARAEPIAKTLFPLGERLDAEPWLGRRPCTPDMMPIIGPAPKHKGLWFSFGHAHHGLTLAAVTGRMVAEMVTGQKVFVDPAPFAPSRFV
ncbi:D-amino-acid dehydrogenase OS=Bosea thiooxidans OX=53254 GN=SAMN05660750_04021 PE=4 SV=1 [Bosea thiooxidans]|uniref:D-amino-acid dehydrogenase n=1 Tax=Bosea thiooxidans TaxID=53254 RepID=A0A1T5GGV4_9HYPH|nr:FAD-binding oxidoreductase [Bosea thiooxidans]SKC07653.1 D-amino-acid dehydrogenase [Bosea thiooxidans]